MTNKIGKLPNELKTNTEHSEAIPELVDLALKDLLNEEEYEWVKGWDTMEPVGREVL